MIKNIIFVTLFLVVICGWSDLPFQGNSLCCASEVLYESRLDKGLSNTEAYSYLLIQKAREDKGRARELLETAKEYSPNLPAVYFELARQSFSFSSDGIFEGIDYVRQGLNAYKSNFWWQFNLDGELYISLLISYVLALIITVAIRLPLEQPLLLHDILEDKRKGLFLLSLLLLSLFGFFALLAGALFLVGLYLRKEDRVFVYMAFFSLLLSPLILRVADTFLVPPSPELRAIVAVNEGEDNQYALATLKAGKDFPSDFSYALALKREGDPLDAIQIYKALLTRSASPLVLTNLGNAYYDLKDLEAAKESYQSAVGIKPLPAAFYNLSQVYRETLDFAKGDEYFLEAAKLDNKAVSRFVAMSGKSPNRFVVDETLPMSDLWEYAQGRGRIFGLSFSLAAALMIPAFFLVNKKIKVRAHRCKRCGAIFCSKCSRNLIWSEMCPRCYRFLIKVEELDSRERIASILSVYQIQTKRRRTVKLLAYTVPGLGQIYSGRVLTGLLFLWLFLFPLSVLVMNRHPFTGLSPFVQGWLEPPAILLMGLAYLFSIIHMRRGISRGWL
ncbi:MAG TPA: hypothetical protein DCP92_10490 [Nitrospiraceae bacterium]|nr:hypothetical protein [Nitrospiraceae bacterium]